MNKAIAALLPASLVIESRGTSVTMDVTKLTDEIVAKLVLHGLTQKVSDSAASALTDAGFKGQKFADLTEGQQAEVQKAAREAMTKVAASLESGEWGVERTGGAGVDPVTAEIRSMLRPDYKAAWIAENNKEGWKALEEAEIVAAIDELFAAQDADTQDAIEAAARESLRLKAAAKNAAKGFKLAMPKA